MDAIKFIFKWTVIVFGLLFALMAGIGIIGNFQMKQEKQAEAAFQRHIAAKEVVSGMNPSQVQQVWGKPDRVTKGTFHGVQVEQWIYSATPPKYDNARYVGFREGQAVIINSSQSQSSSP